MLTEFSATLWICARRSAGLADTSKSTLHAPNYSSIYRNYKLANAMQKLREMLNFDNDEMAKPSQM
jgi:hypothetical protein